MVIFSSLSGLNFTYEDSAQDYHQYTLPNYFVGQFNFFDNMPAGNPIQVGEYAVVQNNTDNVNDSTNWDNAKK